MLTTVDGLGPASVSVLIGAMGSARAVLGVALRPAAERRLTGAWRGAGLDGRVFDAALAGRIVAAAATADELLGPLRAARLTLLTIADPRYPPRLREIALPPPVLVVCGDASVLSAERSVAVVGTRRPTEAGRQLAARIGREIAATGAVVVSGLAAGIDGAAHAAAITAGRTVAVLGGGHDRLFPAMHRRLVADIVAAGGAVISEHLPQVRPQRWSFPQRNRIIAGLADATVVVEAGERSGALITAEWALEQGRGCFLVPGALGAAASKGCLAFLRAWPGLARIVAGVPELLDDLELVDPDPDAVAARRSSRSRRGHRAGATSGAALANLGEVAGAVGRLVMAGSATVDEIVGRTGLPVAAVLAALTVLEDRGLVVAAYGRYVGAGPLAGGSSA